MTASVDLFGRPDGDHGSVRQLPLPLCWQTGRAQLSGWLISDSNRALLAALTDYFSWAAPVALLTGPPRSGKSLLSAYVASCTGAVRVIDSAQDCDETALFHAWTAAIAERTPLLVVAGLGWQPTLPDLATRKAAAQDFGIPDPDTELMGALFERRLADHNLVLSADVAGYLAQRVERSFAAIDTVSAALVTAALAEGRALTLPFVRDIVQLRPSPAANSSCPQVAA
jgi:hypothetical protein